MAMEFDDIYAPNRDSFQNQTKPQDEIIKNAFNVMALEMHVCLPVQVTKVLASGYVDVQPLLYTRLLGQGGDSGSVLQKVPVIQGVPVVSPRGADYWVKLPIAVGDVGIVVFAERSIDNWKANLTEIFADPNDTRHHDISDALFIPGIGRANQPLPGSPNDMVLHNGQAEIYLQKDGKFLIENSNEELLSLLSQLSDAVSSLGNAVSSGFTALETLLSPGALAPEIAAASSAASDADTIKGSIDDMTGST